MVDGGDGLLAQLGVARVGVEFGYSGVHRRAPKSIRCRPLSDFAKGFAEGISYAMHYNPSHKPRDQQHSIASVTYSSIIGELIGSFASAASAARRFAATLPAAAAGFDAAAGLAAAALTAGLATEAVVRLVVALVDDDEAAVDFGGGRGAAGGSASLAKADIHVGRLDKGRLRLAPRQVEGVVLVELPELGSSAAASTPPRAGPRR